MKKGSSFYGGNYNSFYGNINTYGNVNNLYELKELGPDFTVSFNDSIKNSKLKQLKVNIEAKQVGQGDPALNNIRSIKKWSEINVKLTGKNLWGGDAVLTDVKSALPGAAIDVDNRTISFTSGASTSHAILGNSIYRSPDQYGVQFKNDVYYTLILSVAKKVAGAGGLNLRIYYDGNNNFDMLVSSELVSGEKKTVKFLTNQNKTVKSLNKVNSSSTTTLYVDECGLFEGNVEINEFQSYKGRTVASVVLPSEIGFVCGGELNLTTGILTITQERQLITTVTGATEDGYVFTRIGDYGYMSDGNKLCNVLMPLEENNQIQEGYFDIINSLDLNAAQVNYWLPGITGSTAEERQVSAQAILDELIANDTPMEVSYPLTVPRIYQLTPVQITTLQGDNNIWADAGTVQLIYKSKK